ncbi:MAG: transpeptidase family protein [Flavobacteriales bacterium]|jgi:cell division protein FtsI (penicillin-binding protein 3)|nr:transpeptidase family protein [Flavobacteriales bacterium]
MSQPRRAIQRIYVVYLLLFALAIAVVVRISVIQFAEREYWEQRAQNQSRQLKTIDAVRGNIYTRDGSLLATSIPRYEIRFDPNTSAITNEVFRNNVDSLSYQLSKLFPHKSAREWKQQLAEARANGERYHLIARRANYTELKRLRAFPIFRKGRYKGGLIYTQRNKRELPFQILAARTIGYHKENVRPVGLEGAYDAVLRGVSGRRLMQKIAGGVWMPVGDENEIEPEDGADIISTIDLNIQDVAENALMEQLQKHNADHGCVVLMEVQTGEVRAIANLTRNDDGSYWERYNYAVGESTEPGSTFKLASLIAAMEDGYVTPGDSVETGKGVFQFYDRKMYDSRKGGHGKITVQHAFEVSSNIGIAKIIQQHYGKNPQRFIDRLYKMNLHQPLQLEIFGEGKPRIKRADDPSWSGISLPWISHGYEVSHTPLQILAFYNAVANNGKLVKPLFAREIRRLGKSVKELKPVVLNPAICSQKTVAYARRMLEGVVENGTASNLRNAHYKIAGKTGTAQIYNAKYGYKYDSQVSYQASFVGYFPADKPRYSCIVVVNAPSNNVYYGNLVAGPIFKEIADKVYATSLDMHDELPVLALPKGKIRLPVGRHGHAKSLYAVYDFLGIPYTRRGDDALWLHIQTGAEKVLASGRRIREGEIPNVVGMDLRDALYIMENLGLDVTFSGAGFIKEQQPAGGTPLRDVQRVNLRLDA